jgi:putative nucleotidyltransferase with HDIG domain
MLRIGSIRGGKGDMVKSKAKILIIDDETQIRDWLSFKLEQQGHTVITAQNGNEGIEKVQQEKFDIAIVDIIMPEMNGITVLDHLKRIDPDIEAIMVTGFGTMETAVESMRKGAYDYISKPFIIEELSMVIEKAIEKQQLKETIALYEISKAIVSTIEFDQLLKIIIDMTTAVLKSDDASLLLFDNKKKLYVAAASYDLNEETKKKTRLAIGERIAGWSAGEQQPLILIDGFGNEPRFKDIKGRKEVKSALILPLIGKINLLGILNINRINVIKHFTENDLHKANIFASQIALAVENAYLFKELTALYMSTIRSLANAIDAKDHYTNKHSEHVAELAVAIANEMGLTIPELLKIQQASQIHDLGKIGIHDFIINKTGKLSDQEMEEIKSHPLKGAQILEPIGFLSDIVELIKQHHERFDGSGYPYGLKGEKICLEARIIAVADAYDAMISDRPYRKALTKEQAITELNKYSNIQFDKRVVAAFLKVLEKGININR